MRGLEGSPYGCVGCPEARPSVYYCAEVRSELRCLGPLPSNHATIVVTAGNVGEGGG